MIIVYDNKLKIHQRHLQFLAIEIYKEKYPIFTEKGYFPLHSKRKHLEIWNKLIKFQRKCFVEQSTNKVKRM